jgi:hypothetical protein
MKTTSPGAIPRVRLAKIAHEFGTPLGSFSQKVISRRLPGFVGQNGTTPYALGFVWPRSRAEFAPPWVRSAKIRRTVRTRWVRLAKIARIFRTARFVCQNRRTELAPLGFVRPDRALSLRSLGFDGIRGGCLGSFGQNSAYKNRLSRRRRRRGPFRCRLYEPSLPIGVFISFLPPISPSQTQPSEEQIGSSL